MSLAKTPCEWIPRLGGKRSTLFMWQLLEQRGLSGSHRLWSSTSHEKMRLDELSIQALSGWVENCIEGIQRQNAQRVEELVEIDLDKNSDTRD
eukprot:21055-Amorphochlora_amoeboformis.AAC.1